MPFSVISSKDSELTIERRGSLIVGITFLTLGFLVELGLFILFVMLMSHIDFITYLWLVLGQTTFLSFTTFIFIFSGGSVLIGLKESGWRESWVISSESRDITSNWQLFFLKRSRSINYEQIQAIQIRQMKQDPLGIQSLFRLEVKTSENEVLLLFETTTTENEYHSAHQLGKQVTELLKFPAEIMFIEN